MKCIRVFVFMVIFSGASASAAERPLEMVPIQLPSGEPGIGFDDLGYAPALRRVLAPAGRAGDLDLIDPNTKTVTRIPGFSSQAMYTGGHDTSVTSADGGPGVIFATDRTSQELAVVDPRKKTVVFKTKLGGSPDYVRYVSATHEIWVTEPDNEQIEVFAFSERGISAAQPKMTIAVRGGPESLVIDPVRKRAYTHLWKGSTVEISLNEHQITAKWPNGCAGSRGIALDEERGYLFAGCSEGKAVVMDVNHNGAILSSLEAGSGVDVISYSSLLRHLYLPGAKSESMAVMDVSEGGKLTLLGTVSTAEGAHCVASDESGGAWVCDPKRGRLLYFRDALTRR